MIAFVIIWKWMKVTPPPANQKECLKFFILDFGITIPCLPWTIWCHVGTSYILHGLGYRKVNSFFINHFHFSGGMKICTSYTIYMLGRNPFVMGESTLSPPKILVTRIFAINFFGSVWTSHFGLFLLVLSIFN